MLAEVGDLLASTAVDEGVALLEPQHRLALLDACERHLLQLLLGAVRIAGELAGDMDGRSPGDKIQHTGRHELIGQDEVGVLDGLVRCLREEIGVAGTASGEDDLADAMFRGRRRAVAL